VPAIASTDVTYTERPGQKSKLAGSRHLTLNKVRVQFGDGTLTYPTTGVPLTLAKLGLTTEVRSLTVHNNAIASANPLWVWNGSQTNPRLFGLEVNAAGSGDEQLINLDDTDAPVAQDLEVIVIGY
jgi:hypothetical protein